MLFETFLAFSSSSSFLCNTYFLIQAFIAINFLLETVFATCYQFWLLPLFASFPRSPCSHLLLDINIKGQMICDLLNPAGFVLPNTEAIIPMFSSPITMSTSLLVCILAGSMGSPIVTLERDDVWVFLPAWSPLLLDLPQQSTYTPLPRQCP